MDNILVAFLKTLHVRYTSSYANNLYEEHPHKYNLYGLSNMLEEYKIPNAGIRIANKNIHSMKAPFVAHIGTDFVVVKQVATDGVIYHWKDRDITISKEQFSNLWTGIILLAEPDSHSIEPEYKKHLIWEVLDQLQIVLLVGIPIVAFSWLYVEQNPSVINTLYSLFNIFGVLISLLLLQKQVYMHGQYADKICSLFRQKDCNDVLESGGAKLFGWLSWGEIGAGYFLSNVCAMALIPESISFLIFVNICALPYTFWSIWYQYKIVKQWCMLCVIIQGILWLNMLIALSGGLMPIVYCGLIDCVKLSMIYLFFILLINKICRWISNNKRVTKINQELNSIKATNEVFEALLKKQPYFQVDHSNSSILFGNPNASLQISILTNPHCAPCARMHAEIEKLLKEAGDKLCIQYVFSAFDSSFLKSNRFLIAAYHNESIDKALEIFHQWYLKGKNDADNYIRQSNYDVDNKLVEKEIQEHNKWKEMHKLSATPTVLINGYLLPDKYRIKDMVWFVNSAIGN